MNYIWRISIIGTSAYRGDYAMRLLCVLGMLIIGVTISLDAQSIVYPIITPENIKQVEQLQVIGRGLIYDAVYSPDGDTLAVATTRGIWLYDAHDMTTEPRFIPVSLSESFTTVYITGLAYSPNGQFIAVQLWRTVQIIDVATGDILYIFGGFLASSADISFSPDGRFIALGGDFKIMIWDLSTGVLDKILELKSIPEKMMYRPNTQTIAVGFYDGEIQIWDTQTGELQNTIDDYPDMMVNTINHIGYSPDGRYLVAVFYRHNEAKIRVLDAETGELYREWDGNHVAFSPNSRFMALSDDEGTIYVWDVQTGILQKTIQQTLRLYEFIDKLAYSPDGQSLLCLTSGIFYDAPSEDRILRIFDIETGELLTENYESYVFDVMYDPTGQFLMSHQWSDKQELELRVWDIETGAWVDETNLPSFIISQNALPDLPIDWETTRQSVYSPDGSRLVVEIEVKEGNRPDWYDMLQLWDVETGTLMYTLNQAHALPIISLFYSLDGQTVFVISAWGDIDGWDVRTGALTHAFHRQGIIIYDMDYSPDTRLIALGLQNNTIEIIELQTGTIQHTLTNHVDSVSAIDFSPDGRFIVSGSADGTIRIWGIPSN
jgi:WD40 repeat protein